jgi:hypothetical protein
MASKFITTAFAGLPQPEEEAGVHSRAAQPERPGCVKILFVVKNSMDEIKPRRPASSRPRPASARPAAAEDTETANPEDDGIFEDNETWLFSMQVFSKTSISRF